MISKSNIVPFINWHKVTVRHSSCISRRTSRDLVAKGGESFKKEGMAQTAKLQPS